MTQRKKTALAERRREAKERREAVDRERQVKGLKISDDIDPAELLKAAKLLIHTEVMRMAKEQTADNPLTPNDVKKLSQAVATIGQMLAISEKIKPDLSELSDADLAAIAGEAT